MSYWFKGIDCLPRSLWLGESLTTKARNPVPLMLRSFRFFVYYRKGLVRPGANVGALTASRIQIYKRFVDHGNLDMNQVCASSSACMALVTCDPTTAILFYLSRFPAPNKALLVVVRLLRAHQLHNPRNALFIPTHMCFSVHLLCRISPSVCARIR